MKAPYKILIKINMFSGRTDETKKKLYKSLAHDLEKKIRINPLEIFILINEQPKENWGVRGGIAVSDIKLDFKVEI